MRGITRVWKGHGTKLLGTAQIIVSGFPAISGLIHVDHVKYWLAANVVLGALTINRGMENSKNAKPNP